MSSSDLWGSVPFPAGDNDTDTSFGGGNFNLTVLKELEYHLFENGTVSNVTRCFLAFQPYTPTYLFPNGTWQNYTSCYIALDPIGPRAGTGIGFGAGFAITLIFMLLNLKKHGPLYLPTEKRFFPISRRWQWYWGFIVSIVALISLFTNVDVDRYYVMELPIILTSFFWFLMQYGILALVWEAVRHWGSWNERQIVDPEPYAMKDDDRRSKVELLIPIWFYLWVWLNFFLLIPRNWGNIQLQRTPEQVLLRAKPSATDARSKAAAFCLFVAWLTILASLVHSLKHYHTRRKGLVGKVVDFFRSIPVRFLLILPLALFIVGFQVFVAFEWDYSPLNAKGNVAAIYVGGYLPTLLILIVQIVYGHLAPNEDLELIRQRRLRGEVMNRELGIVPKPSWWSRVRNGNKPANMRDIVTQNVNEVGGRKRTTPVRPGVDDSSKELRGDAVELKETANNSGSTSTATSPGGDAPDIAPYGGRSERRRTERTIQHAANVLFPPDETPPPPSYDESTEPPQPPARSDVARNISGSTVTSISNQRPQQIQSMLDV